MNREASRIRNDIRNLLCSQALAVLATAGRRFPYCTLVGFAFTADLKILVFATVRDTRKFKNIEIDSAVSLLIDSRTNSVGDFKNAAALTVLGTAAEVPGAKRGPYRRLYLKRHPHLHDFVASPNTALVAVTVHRYIFVQRFQEVRELDMR
jgi:nitroimidazol reductase NimA-like FMN-containing flavoprotein (pyridoxamine 5'-phosphate oxidase superfamily)